MSLPPGATLVSGQLPDTQALPPGATLVSGSLPPPSLYDRAASAVKDFASRVAHPVAPTMEQMQQANIGAGKFGAETMVGQEVIGPVAKAVESTVIPAAKAIPFVGRAVDAINQAPTLFGKALGGATVGGGTGAVEGFIRGKSPAEIASEAGKGALYGGALGLALPLMSKLAQTGGSGTFAARPRPFADYEAPPEAAGVPQGNPTPFTPATPAETAVAPKVEGPIPPPKKLTLGPGEDTGIGLGNDHIITNAQGDRVGSIQVEQKPNGVAHVHWMGGDFSDYGRQPVVAAIKEAYPEAETITYDRRRLAKGATAATTQPRQMNVAQAPSVDDVVNQATGNKPTPSPSPNVPLKDQLTSSPKPEPPASSSGEQDPLKVKYPDPAQRQMVRANGERIVQAVGDDADTMKAVHDLTRVDLRQALVNSGEDMGQRTVSNSKFAGEGSITREDAFNRLLGKGLKPQDIVRLAKQTVAQ
jgi:hypothetical protein